LVPTGGGGKVWGQQGAQWVVGLHLFAGAQVLALQGCEFTVLKKIREKGELISTALVLPVRFITTSRHQVFWAWACGMKIKWVASQTIMWGRKHLNRLEMMWNNWVSNNLCQN
jgi:hypothetical protein